MHDISTLDSRGIPGCVVATEEFKPAAAAQGSAIGFEPSVVWVPHPIQNLSPDELRTLAKGAFERIVAACTPVAGG